MILDSLVVKLRKVEVAVDVEVVDTIMYVVVIHVTIVGGMSHDATV